MRSSAKVWIIGGTSGIGAAVEEEHDKRYTHETLVTGEEVDVREIEQLKGFIQKHPEIRHVVFSAGINRLSWIGSSEATRDNPGVIDTNLMGFINTIDALAWSQVEIHGNLGVMNVVAVSSDAASRPMRTSMAYCASKAGLDMAVRVAARELGPKGWRVNAVSPGMTAPTGMSKYIDERVPKIRGWSERQTQDYERSQEVVQGRISPQEVAEVICDVLHGPPHLNGSIVTINGGR